MSDRQPCAISPHPARSACAPSDEKQHATWPFERRSLETSCVDGTLLFGTRMVQLQQVGVCFRLLNGLGWHVCRAHHPHLPPLLCHRNLQDGTGFFSRLVASRCSPSSLVEACSTTSRKRTELLARNFHMTRARRTSSSWEVDGAQRVCCTLWIRQTTTS